MSGAVILNWVLGAIIIVVIVGGGMYAVFFHGKAGPNYQDAQQYQGAKADPDVTPLAEHVPSEPAAAADGLTEAQSPLQDAGLNAGPNGGQASARPPGDRTAEPGREPE
jgi:hypothetical protein